MVVSRCLLIKPWCAALAQRLQQQDNLSQFIPTDFVAVQGTYFEKSSTRNWLVHFHQDLSIPVAEKIAAPELQGWSQKEGITFVQASAAILTQLVAVRLHLDACGKTDGPLRVIPGSHQQGRLEPAVIDEFQASRPSIACTATAGAALVLRPLILHASSKATGNSQRRVLHFLFAPPTLPYGLRWPIC